MGLLNDANDAITRAQEIKAAEEKAKAEAAEEAKQQAEVEARRQKEHDEEGMI